MATRRKSRTSKASKKQNPLGSRNRALKMASGLDPAAAAYARALLDPCNGPLVRPVYEGSGSGYLTRFRTTRTINVGPAGKAVFCFCPGIMSTASTGAVLQTDEIGSVVSIVEDSANPGTFVYYNVQADQPGYEFLTSLSGGPNGRSVSFRPVSACLQLTYSGTELNRSGLVARGFLSDIEQFDQSVTGGVGAGVLDSFISSSQSIERTSNYTYEVKFNPNRGDMRFKDLDAAATLGGARNHSAMYIAVSGLQASSPVQVSYVVTYEWIPNVTAGLSIPTERSMSTTSLEAIQAFLQKMGNWMVANHKTLSGALNMAGALMFKNTPRAQYIEL